MITKVNFNVFGTVQGVMFRQTFIRGALKRSLIAGATNNKTNSDKVTCFLEGEEKDVNELIERLKSSRPINSWGAKVEQLEIIDEGIELSKHDVTTDNVDQFNWNPNVEMFL